MFALAKQAAKTLGTSRLLSTIYHEARLRYLQTKKGAPILVYQMGKVGSRSIVDSLKELNLDNAIYHMHFLNEENIKRANILLHKFYGNNYNVNNWCLHESKFVAKNLISDMNSNFKIISLVREPIARNVSSFFQNIEKFIPNCIELYKKQKIDVSYIAKKFLREFHEHDMPLTWFDTEIKNVFGIDVFSTKRPFPKEKGFFIHKDNRVEILIIKTEYFNTIAAEALQEFLNIEKLNFKTTNSSEHKNYYCMYRDFIKHIELPHEYLEKMYESKYVNHFYSTSEIERFKQKWSKC